MTYIFYSIYSQRLSVSAVKYSNEVVIAIARADYDSPGMHILCVSVTLWFVVSGVS